MNNLDAFFNLEPNELVSLLPNYQQDLINQLKPNEGNYEVVIDKWLTAKPANTIGFGGIGSNSIYKDKILEELEKFICGDDKYDSERKKLLEIGNGTPTFILGSVCTAIGSAIGTSGTYLLPIVVLLLATAGKITKNGWCEARKKIRQSNPDV